MSELKQGDQAPDFTLPTDGGGTVSLKQLRGKPVILYFYPKDDTPGCTRQASSFRDHYGSISKKAVLLGVSLDDAESHQKFKRKFKLPFPLLVDSRAAVSKAYGVYKEKNMYGRKFWGIERTTYVIDPDGVIKAVFPRVKVDGHTREVLEALRKS